MPRRPCPVPPSIGPVAEPLDHLASVLAATAAGRPHAELVVVRLAAGRPEVGLAPLPPHLHPTDALLGRTIARRWTAAGILVSGTARRLDGGAPRPVTTTVIVDRSGHVAHAVVGADDDLPELTTPPTGPLVDLLGRALGRPTAAPGTSPREVWSLLWLDQLVAEVCAEGDPLERGPAGLADLARLREALAALPDAGRPEGWATVRRALALEGPPTGPAADVLGALGALVDPVEARWHDDGSLARWVEGLVPTREALLGAIDALYPPEVARDVRGVVAAAAGGP